MVGLDILYSRGRVSLTPSIVVFGYSILSGDGKQAGVRIEWPPGGGIAVYDAVLTSQIYQFRNHNFLRPHYNLLQIPETLLYSQIK